VSESLREIPGPAGPLEVLMDLPAGTPRAAVVFAHPLPTHGGTMHTKVVFQGAKGLTRIGCAVLRFNFRGVGRSAGTWDEGRGEMADYRAAIDFMAAQYPDVDRYEFASVTLSTKPKFIIHGERDELISLKAVREFYARLHEPKELVEIDRANHLFDGQASEVGDALEELLSDYSCKTL